MTNSPEAVAAARAGDSKSHGADPLDQLAHMTLARATRGLSPAAAQLAWHDWALHLAISPGKRRKLLEEAFDGHRLERRAGRVRPPTPTAPTALSPWNRTAVSKATPGKNGPSTSSIRASCCNRNGGNPPRPGCGASRASMRTWCPFPPGNGWTCCRRSIFSGPTPRCCKRPPRPVAPICGGAR